MTIAMIVEFEVRSSNVSEFAELLSEKARASMENEHGCLGCDVLHSVDQITMFTVFELFHDVRSVQVHLESEHFLKFQRLTAHYATRKQCRAFSRIFPKNGLRAVQ